MTKVNWPEREFFQNDVRERGGEEGIRRIEQGGKRKIPNVTLFHFTTTIVYRRRQERRQSGITNLHMQFLVLLQSQQTHVGSGVVTPVVGELFWELGGPCLA